MLLKNLFSKLSLIMFAALALFFFCGNSFAQVDVSSWEKIQSQKDEVFLKVLSPQLDSLSTAYGSPFVLTQYNKVSWTTYPWTYTTKRVDNASGTAYLEHIIQGSFYSDSGFLDVDTLTTSDSTLTTTGASGTLTFNGKYYPYYRDKYVGVTDNPDSVKIETDWYNPQAKQIIIKK